MAFGMGRGFNRLFLVLMAGWALYCAVVFPMQYQWEQQQKVFAANRADVKNCDELVKEAPGWDLTQNCYKRAGENLQAMLDEYSLGRFWILDVVLWKMLVPALLIPPLVVYTIAIVCRWVWNGFKVPSKA